MFCENEKEKKADDYIKSRRERKKGSRWVSHQGKNSCIGHCEEQY